MDPPISIDDSYQTDNFSIVMAGDGVGDAAQIQNLPEAVTQEKCQRSSSKKSDRDLVTTITSDTQWRSSRHPPSTKTPRTPSLGHRVRAGSKDIDNDVKEIASFEGCQELLRGSYLSVILRNQARIFADSSGSAATYALSKSVEFIDAFISHNWSVPRWQKWLCLSLHFNLRIAMVLSYVVVSPICVIAAYGWVPICQPAFAPYPRSYIFRLILYPVWLSLLLFYRDIVRCFPSWSPIVFLDKTCIHQEDRAIQRRGIEKLGAFLCYSRTMVICYTDIYLLKLWTVYEVASFMTLQSVEQMRVIPVMFPIVFITCMTCLWIAGAIGLWPELALNFYYTMFIFLFALCYGMIVAFRRWARSKVNIYRAMSGFSARNCTCFCEDDRPLVYANIAALMKETQDIGKDASEDAALDCFDNLVRNHLGEPLLSSVGKYAMRYELAAAVGCAFFAPVLDQLVGLAHGMPVRELCSYALWYATVGLCFVPTTFMLFSMWAEHCLCFTGWREYVYLALGLLTVMAVSVLKRGLCDVLELWANESDVGLAVFVVFFPVSSTLARNVMDSVTFCPTRKAKDNLAARTGLDAKVPIEAQC